MTTAAEVIKAFATAERTTSLATLAFRAGATRTKERVTMTYRFPDGSVLVTRGRGANHSYWEESHDPVG